MIKEVSLPFHFMLCGEKMFPVFHSGFHSRFTWKCNDCMQMIRHEDHQTTMPDQVVVVVRRGGEYGATGRRMNELNRSLGNAVDRDEEETAIGNPLWCVMWQSVAFGSFHENGKTEDKTVFGERKW